MRVARVRIAGVLIATAAFAGGLAAFLLHMRSGRLDAFDTRAIESSAYMVVSDQDAQSDPPEVTAVRKRLHAMNLNPKWSDQDLVFLSDQLAAGIPADTFDEPKTRAKVLPLIVFNEALSVVRIRLEYGGPIDAVHREQLVRTLLDLTTHTEWHARERSGATLVDCGLHNEPRVRTALQRLLQDPVGRVADGIAASMRRRGIAIEK